VKVLVLFLFSFFLLTESVFAQSLDMTLPGMETSKPNETEVTKPPDLDSIGQVIGYELGLMLCGDFVGIPSTSDYYIRTGIINYFVANKCDKYLPTKPNEKPGFVYRTCVRSVTRIVNEKLDGLYCDIRAVLNPLAPPPGVN
jgi:hypothetical protein